MRIYCSAGRYSGELSLRCSEFELAELVELAAAVGRESAPEHRWEVTIEAREPVLVCADRRRIEQVLENLVANAAKYSLPGEPIGSLPGLTCVVALVGAVQVWRAAWRDAAGTWRRYRCRDAPGSCTLGGGVP